MTLKPKTKALIFNFLGFAVFYLIARYFLVVYLPVKSIFMVVTAAIIANILAPKFGVIDKEGKQQIMMKWVFIKGLKEIN